MAWGTIYPGSLNDDQPGGTMAENDQPLIVVGVNGSEDGVVVLRWAADYARAVNGRIRVVLAWQNPQFASFVPFRIEAEVVAMTEHRLRTLVHDSVDGLPAETAVIEGLPAKVLAREAERADLLVIGAAQEAGQSSLSQQWTTGACPCPVVIVPLDVPAE